MSEKKSKEPGSKERIRRFLRARVGIVTTSKEIQDAAGPRVTEWARRVRELREDEGWKILTNNDRADLKPGQYLLAEMPPEKTVIFSRPISARLRAQVFERNGFTCQHCGLSPGEIDPATGRKVRLHVGHIDDKILGGREELSNLRALCSTCNQGEKNLTAEKPTWIWLLGQLRRAGQDEQKKALEWLTKKFGND